MARPPQPPSCEGMSDSEILRDLWHAVYRDTPENKAGILTRLDRAEQRISLFSWVASSALGTGISAAVGWLITKARE